MKLIFVIAALVSVGFVRARAQSAPTTRPSTPQGTFELVEWVVLVVDPNRPNANDAGAFKSTAPGFARGRREVAMSATVSGVESPAAKPAVKVDPLRQPSPVGVIRLINRGGEAASEDLIDVLIQAPTGQFLGSWPAGKLRSGRQLWEGVQMRPGRGKPVPADAGHWVERLRQGNTLISTGKWTEHFLMYDVEVKYPNVLRVKATAGGYEFANAGSSVVREVDVYVPAQGGWRVAGMKELAAAKPGPATKPATTTATTAPSTRPSPAELTGQQIFEENGDTRKGVMVAGEVTPATAATRPATSRPTTSASTPAAEDVPKDAWREVKVPADAKPLAPADAVAAWRDRLSGAGLTPGDVEVILATLLAHALDAEQLTAVYRIDPAELDRLLPLEVVPQPAKVTRIGLAIVKNIDPAAGERIAKLVEQLGSPEWEAREAAQSKLAELGAGAKPKLTEALKHKDVEVVYRAERLLDAINNP